MCSFLNNLTGVVCSSIFSPDKPDYYFIRQKTLTTHRNSIIDGRNGYILMTYIVPTQNFRTFLHPPSPPPLYAGHNKIHKIHFEGILRWLIFGLIYWPSRLLWRKFYLVRCGIFLLGIILYVYR